MVQALNRALRDSLAQDDRVLVLGEDVGKLGGVFRVTDELQNEFGNGRVFDTPLAESAIAGVSLGLCLAGWRPVAEMQFAGGVGAAEHHSESPESYYAHTAGLKVVVPSSALDAYALLRRSVADPDPVIFLEPKSRYWSKESGDLSSEGLPIGKARVVRDGTDCTIVSYGAMVTRSLQSATRLSEEGVQSQVLDLRSLVPLDIETIGESVRRTGRAVVVHEAPLTLGMGAEIAARIMEEAFDHLEAPVIRVAGHDTPYPPATLEEHYLPTVDRIAAAVRRTIEY